MIRIAPGAVGLVTPPPPYAPPTLPTKPLSPLDPPPPPGVVDVPPAPLEPIPSNPTPPPPPALFVPEPPKPPPPPPPRPGLPLVLSAPPAPPAPPYPPAPPPEPNDPPDAPPGYLTSPTALLILVLEGTARSKTAAPRINLAPLALAIILMSRASPGVTAKLLIYDSPPPKPEDGGATATAETESTPAGTVHDPEAVNTTCPAEDGGVTEAPAAAKSTSRITSDPFRERSHSRSHRRQR